MAKKRKTDVDLDSPPAILARDVPLEEWLTAILSPTNGKRFIDYQFPTDAHKEEYLKTIDDRSEEDVLKLVKKFLVPSCWLGVDRVHMGWLRDVENNDAERFRKLMSSQYFRRVFEYFSGQSTQLPWEGITWVLDLLPHFPKDALEGLKAYVLAHIQELPDGRLNGLSDAQEIIRAKFIGLPGSNNEKVRFLLSLDWRTFECLVERLYDSMDYQTKLTPPRKDGGRDVIATKVTPGGLEHARIECKFYNEEAVGLGVLQRLLGVVSGEKVNKGVVVTTSRFSKTAIKYADENPRLELINGDRLVLLMNEHLGPSWPLRIERLVSESEKTTAKS